jgi:pilus assembly protein CpaE
MGGALRLATICLDAQSAQEVTDFTVSTPLVRLQDELADYFMEERELPAKWARGAPCEICMIDFDRNRSRARATAEKIHASFPDVAIFAVSSDSQPELIIQAMRSGCSEYLLKPIAREQLLQSIARIAGRRKEGHGTGRMVALAGAKGGVGVTMMATHLGAILARFHSRRTLLVDLHPAFGDAELYLGVLKYQYSFRDLAANADRLDTDLLQSFVVHHRSGLDLLAAPGAPRSPSLTNPENIGASIDGADRLPSGCKRGYPAGALPRGRDLFDRSAGDRGGAEPGPAYRVLHAERSARGKNRGRDQSLVEEKHDHG